ncbi:MAG: FecR domain-containing protein [Robiginitomaculum sp.]|nr:FecR domain-containing protein [Robiginitomaculum sp.]MDQ7076671.1 FecR domain-containing protein [Robiginitomaculum sp.]
MTNKSHISVQNALEEKALHWHVRLHGGDATEADWLDFTSWLEAEPAHNDAYDLVALAWDAAEDLKDSPPVAANDSEDIPNPGNNVVAFPLHRLRKAITAKPMAFGGGFGAAIAATLLVLMAPVFLGPNGSIDPTLYATGIGEQRTVTLADGSTVVLNTDTSIAVTMDKKARHVVLKKGEAYFTVHHEKTRSFTVAANSLRVTDIGTRFDVRMDSDRTLVSVTEGIVEVAPLDLKSDTDDGLSSTLRLVKGQQAVHQVDTDKIKVQSFDPVQITTWQQGYLVFENDDLGSVVSELNRYFPTPLTLAQNDLASLHFSGILQITDQDRAVRDLTALLSLSAEETDSGIILHVKDKVRSQ